MGDERKMPEGLPRAGVLDQIHAAGGRVRVGYPFWLRPLLRRGVIAITLGRTVYLSRAVLATGEQQIERTLRHELEHVRQALRLGTLRFLIAYLREYASLRRKGLGAVEAYRQIGFEREARAAESVSDDAKSLV